VRRGTSAVVWHDVECAAYDVDLPFWRELAGAADGPVLDLGCGTGRVTLDLARRGHHVTGLDSDPDLVRELSARARRRGLRVKAVAADARSFDLGRAEGPGPLVQGGAFALAIAPMQVMQLMDGSDGRRSALASIRRHLRPGGVFAAALADPFQGVPDDGQALPPLPDIREDGGWVYASTPVAVRREHGSAAIDRHRQSVSPTGEIVEWVTTISLDLVSPAELEAEGADCGFTARERAWIEETTEWTGSTVVILEAS
jgi:SAM-dependent methyltransferase